MVGKAKQYIFSQQDIIFFLRYCKVFGNWALEIIFNKKDWVIEYLKKNLDVNSKSQTLTKREVVILNDLISGEEQRKVQKKYNQYRKDFKLTLTRAYKKLDIKDFKEIKDKTFINILSMLSERLMANGAIKMTRTSEIKNLTPVQRKLLKLASMGYSNCQMASIMKINNGSLFAHFQRIYLKMGLSQRTDIDKRTCAILMYLKEYNLIDKDFNGVYDV